MTTSVACPTLAETELVIELRRDHPCLDVIRANMRGFTPTYTRVADDSAERRLSLWIGMLIQNMESESGDRCDAGVFLETSRLFEDYNLELELDIVTKGVALFDALTHELQGTDYHRANATARTLERHMRDLRV